MVVAIFPVLKSTYSSRSFEGHDSVIPSVNQPIWYLSGFSWQLLDERHVEASLRKTINQIYLIFLAKRSTIEQQQPLPWPFFPSSNAGFQIYFSTSRVMEIFSATLLPLKPSRVGHFEPAVNSILGTGAHYFALGTCVAYVREMKSPNLLKPLMFSWGKTIIMHKDSTEKHCRLNFWKNPAEIIHSITISCRQFLTFYDFSEQIIGFDTRTKS